MTSDVEVLARGVLAQDEQVMWRDKRTIGSNTLYCSPPVHFIHDLAIATTHPHVQAQRAHILTSVFTF